MTTPPTNPVPVTPPGKDSTMSTAPTESTASSRNPLRRLVDARLGGVPLLVPVLLTAGVIVAGIFGRIPDNMIGGLAVITGFGMLLGPLGNHLPIINKIGGGALLCLMVPSVLVYFDVFNEATLDCELPNYLASSDHGI